MQFQNFVEPVIGLALKAGDAIMGFYENGAEISQKEDKSPVTEADIAANDIIVQGLKKLTPDVQIVAEESTNAPAPGKKGTFWLVDPLDGTKSFIKRTGEFTVNIALVAEGVPVFGVIYIPVQERLYFVGKDGKAYRQPRDGAKEAISVRTPPVSGLTVVASQNHRTPETDAFINTLPKVEKLISANSSLKLTLIAEGKADIYPRFGPTCEWDIAAGHAILRAAGGTLTTEDGAPFSYGKPNYLNGNFIARGT